MRNFTQSPPGTASLRLSVEESPVGQQEMGFLYTNDAAKKVEVGTATGREFKLVRCLFSPQNDLSAKYNPVAQTLERVFSAIRVSADDLNSRLNNAASTEDETADIIKRSLRVLQRGEIGRYLTFVFLGDKLRMDIASPLQLQPQEV